MKSICTPAIHRTKALSRRRTGTVYIMAMGTSLIVVCLGLASLQAVRVQRRMNEGALQNTYAKELAQAGIEFVQQRIREDMNWRTTFASGPVTRSAAGGSFSVTLTDPRDGSLNNRSTDPVVLVSVGTFGNSIQKLTAYLEPQSQLFASCRSSLYAVERIELEDTVVDANQWAYSEDKFDAIGVSTINMNCFGKNGVQGSGYTQRSGLGGNWPMEKPTMAPASAQYLGNEYAAIGVPINVASLPTGGVQLIQNGEFESDTMNWTGVCTRTRDTSQKLNGVASCRIDVPIVGPQQDVTLQMVKGHHYTVSFWVRPLEKQDFTGEIWFYGSDGAPIVRQSSPVVCEPGVWTNVSFTADATWNGTLVKATLWVRNQKLSHFHLDAVSMLDIDREVGTRYIENVLLDDSNNPFGAVSTNGIYSVAAPGERIVVRNSRLNATLVVQAATRVELLGAVSWEPSGRNYPALIANTLVEDRTTNDLIHESDLGVNFNIAGSPMANVVDADVLDSYPNTVRGAILCTENIELHGKASFSGPLFSNKAIRIRTNNLRIEFPTDMIMNPPPGLFANPPKMRLITSSVQSIP